MKRAVYESAQPTQVMYHALLTLKAVLKKNANILTLGQIKFLWGLSPVDKKLKTFLYKFGFLNMQN